MNPLGQKLKKALLAQTQNKRFNDIINKNNKNLYQQIIPSKKNQNIPIRFSSQRTLVSLDDKNYIKNNQMVKYDKIRQIKSKSHRKRKLSSTSSQNSLAKKKQKYQIEGVKLSNITKGITSKNLFGNNQKTGQTKVNYVKSQKSDNITPFSLFPSSFKKVLSSKISNINNMPSSKTFQTSNSHQQKIYIPNQFLNVINNSLTIFINKMKIEQNLDYKKFIQIINRKKQQKLVNGVNLQKIFQQIKIFIIKYNVNADNIDVNKIIKLQHKLKISNFQKLKLFSNWQNILNNNLKIPGIKYYYPDPIIGKQLASSKIISIFRMIWAKKYVKNISSLIKKVKKIQQQWRKSLLVKKNRQNLLRNVKKKIEQTKKLQEKLIYNWQLIKTSRKVEVHIGSLSLQYFKRITIQNRLQFENTQMTRIFKALQNPDTFVIYVSPFQLSETVLKYYQRLFKIITKDDNSFKQKVHFIYPENTQRLNKICELSTLNNLLYSPKAMKRIRFLIKNISNFECSYIIPCYPSIQYVNLSYYLNIPIFSSSQSLCKLYSTKIGYKQIIKSIIKRQNNFSNNKSTFKLFKSSKCIFSQKQLLNTLALLIYKNQQVKRWYFKIDDQVKSRGIAYFNVNSINLIKKLNEQKNQNILQQLIDNQKQIIKIILSELKSKLKQKLKILHKNIYSNYKSYITHFLTRGGIIQSSINSLSSQDSSEASISFLIQPNGDFEILGTYSKLHLNSKLICQTIQLPAKNIFKIDFQKIVRNLYKQIYLKMKMFGYFTIDLLIDHTDIQYIPYVIGLDFYLNQYTSCIFAIKSLTNVNYDKDNNQFIQITTSINNITDYSILVKSKISKVQMQKQNKIDSQEQIINNKRPSQIQSQKNKQLQNKHAIKYIYCPKISLIGLQNISKFFQKCKFQNISFDLKKLLGTVFLLLDDLECQNIGFLSCQKSQKAFNSQILKVIYFLTNNYRMNNCKQEKNKQNLNVLKKQTDQIGLLRGIILTELNKSEQYKKEHNHKNQNINNLQYF